MLRDAGSGQLEDLRPERSSAMIAWDPTDGPTCGRGLCSLPPMSSKAAGLCGARVPFPLR